MTVKRRAAQPKPKSSIGGGKLLASLEEIDPLVAVADLNQAITFFQNSLDFAIKVKMDGYA